MEISSNLVAFSKNTNFKKKDEHKAKIDFVITTTPFLDIGGMLVNSVLKSNVIAQHVVSDVGNKSKQNGTAGRQNYNKTISHWCILHKILSNYISFVILCNYRNWKIYFLMILKLSSNEYLYC